MYTCVHTGGKFVGNDCVKLLKHAKHIMAALKPRQIKIANGAYTIFGTHNKAQLYYTLYIHIPIYVRSICLNIQ